MGMPIDWEEDILHFTTSDGLQQTRLPDEVQRKHIFEAMAAKGYTESWTAAKLLVRDNPDLNIPRRKIDSIDAIQLIHRCGGIAILAHPHLIDETVHMPGRNPYPRAEFIDQLIDSGLDGIETRYTYDKTTYKGTLTPEQIESEVLAYYRGRVKCFSGGSDYHAGHKKGEKKIRYPGERGITLDEYSVIKDLLSNHS
jgi:predicted metal-dependent phosphoesterase TrpH